MRSRRLVRPRGELEASQNLPSARIAAALSRAFTPFSRAAGTSTDRIHKMIQAAKQSAAVRPCHARKHARS